jgi:hypothetical protein
MRRERPMSKPDPSSPATHRSRHDDDHHDERADAAELVSAAADLEALTEAYEASARALQTTEAMADALLDDPMWCAMVLDHELRVRAISRGMADRLGVDRTAVGQHAARVVPSTWHLERHLVPSLPEDGWRELPLENGPGSLHARRATDADRDTIYVLRYLPTR